ncbi:MAG: site-specific integrase [Actinomycetota bacterium]
MANAPGGINKRSDGRWSVTWYDSRGRRRVTTRPTRTEAYSTWRQRQYDVARKVERHTDPTVRELVDDWLADLERRRAPAANARANYAGRCALIPDSLARMRVSEVHPRDVQGALDEVLARPTRFGKPRSRQTVQQLRGHLNAAWTYARAMRITVDDPVRDTYVPPPGDDTDSERQTVDPLELDDAKAIIDALDGHRLQTMVMVGMTVGPRLGELVGARWCQLDLLDELSDDELSELDIDTADRVPTMTIDTQITRDQNGRIHRKLPKGRKTRVVALPIDVALTLRRWRREWPADRRPGPARNDRNQVATRPRPEPVGDALVWPSRWEMTTGGPRGGGPLMPSHVRAVLSRAARRAGVPEERMTRWHGATRHTAGTQALAGGASPKTVQDLLGHTTSAMLDRYTHALEEHRRDAARIIGDRWARHDPPSASEVPTPKRT